MTTKNWDAFHRRGEVLRTVIDEADARRDGTLPSELPGVAETFADDLALVAALQLRWHTRLSGRIERCLMDQPMDLESAVLTAWRQTRAALPGIRAILDAHTENPTGVQMREVLETAQRKDWALLAAMAGQAPAAYGVSDEASARVGRRLEQRARAAYAPDLPPDGGEPSTHRATAETILDRIKATIRAA